MKKTMEKVAVEVTEEGLINISQAYGIADDEQIVTISPDQVDVLSQWLQDAKKKISETKK